MERKVRLFVVDRGFTIIGWSEIDPELVYHWLVTGRTVRRWGTDQGLTQLCTSGPTDRTILDPIALRHIPFRSIIEVIEVDQFVWMSHLSWPPSPDTPGPSPSTKTG